MMKGMRTFTAARSEHMEMLPGAGALGGRARGLRAPGTIVLAVQEGTGWILRQDGSREILQAGSVAVFEAGDWFEYGYDATDGFKAYSYWENDLPDDEWQAMFAEAFGPDFTVLDFNFT